MMCYTIYETFVGAGGSHIGFRKNGFVSLYVNDNCKEALQTLLYNNPEIKETAFVDNSSIIDVKPNNLLEKTHIEPGQLDVLFGGIVCKGFSMAGERSPNDERNFFYRKQLDLVRVIKPKISIIENVPGIQTANVLSSDAPDELSTRIDKLWNEIATYKGKKAELRKRNLITPDFDKLGKDLKNKKNNLLKYLKDNNYLISVMKDIEKRYDKLGYNIYKQVLNSACYGAATKRERIIIVAVRKDIKIPFIFPEATYSNDYLKSKYPYLYKKGHKYKSAKTVNEALLEIDYTDNSDIDNQPMNHNEKTIKRFSYIPEGDNIANHIDELPDDLKISRFYSRGNTMRLDGNKPSPTLVPGHSNFPVHPKFNRSITVREAACITGFPKKYKFFGSHTKRCEQVGNAVPPPLSYAIAKQTKKLLKQYYSNN